MATRTRIAAPVRYQSRRSFKSFAKGLAPEAAPVALSVTTGVRMEDPRRGAVTMATAAERLELAHTDHRPYQVAIADACHGRNSLVVLPTGLGKTIIAAHVMLRHVEDGGRVLVIAPTRPLVDQHAQTFRTRMPEVDVVALTGTTPAERRAERWRGATVVVATPQVARNDLVAGLLEPDEWSLLVVDEAHRAVGQYAAVDVAEVLRQHGCRVLATTASPGSTPDRIAEVCRTLGIEHVEARGAWDDDVRDYVAPITLEYARVALPHGLERAARRVRAAVHEQVAPLRQIGLYTSRFLGRRDLLRVRDRLRRGGHGRGARASWANSHVSRSLRLLHGAELIETQSVQAARKYLDKLAEDDAKLG
ncbi:MAG TPA: DEAD/DEAH box helicase, partial [Nitriliruptorales bacterium]